MTFGAVSTANFISLAVMTSTQLTLVQLMLSQPSLTIQNLSKLLLTGCHPTQSLGAASMVVSLGFNGDNTESFAVVCRPKSSTVAYTPSTTSNQSPLESSGNTPDAFTQEATAITNNSNSFFSPTLTNPKSTSNTNILIQQVKTNTDTLIEDTISSTVKDLRKLHLDEALRVEEEASRITPVKMIVDITKERAATSNAPNVPIEADTCEPELSPLMGLPIAENATGCDESALMTSLLHIQTETTPVVSRGALPGNVDHSTHMILVQVEYVGAAFQMKILPVAVSLPEQMSNLEIVSLRPLPACTGESGMKSNACGHVTFDDLMFSPSPGKMMSPAKSGMTIHIPQLSVVCRSADLKRLYCFVVSSRDSKHLHIESETYFDLEPILFKSLAAPTKSLSIKGLTLDNVIVKSNNGRLDCCNKLRVVLSTNTDNSEPNSTSDSSKPINLSLHEDGTVVILGLSCTVPLSTSKDKESLETPCLDGRVVSRSSDSAIDGTLQAILDKLSTFEKEVYRRMDTMENAIRVNTERLEELETTLLRGGPHDQASF